MILRIIMLTFILYYLNETFPRYVPSTDDLLVPFKTRLTVSSNIQDDSKLLSRL